MTATPIPRARRSCESRRVAVLPRRSRRASATEPASPSRPTARCGRRSTTATTRPTRTADVDTQYVNEHPPEALARLIPGPRIGLALLQSRRRPGQSAVHPRHVDEQGRVPDGLRRAAAGRAELGRPRGAARAGVHRRCAAAAVRRRARWSACTAHGTGSRRARPRCRSSLGATAIWATSRLWSAASRPTTDRGGAAPSRRWSGRTAPCTSRMTTQAPSTDSLRRGASAPSVFWSRSWSRGVR